MREFLTGNQAVVRGALRAGCDFVAGYPITPASSILSEMLAAFSDRPDRVVQTEDEIAAIGQCIGAAMAGARAMTASSGPGLSLYSENIGLAQMGEVPLVIVDCQRMGPATGGATSNGDGDVVFAGHVTSGGYPLPVLAATDAASAYRLTYEAFNIAERLRTPTIVLLSKDISLTRQTVDLASIGLPPRIDRRVASVKDPFQPYAFDSVASIPAFAPVGGPQRVRFTGSIHDADGLLTVQRAAIERKLTHLREKIEGNARLLEFVEADPEPDAQTLLISYGVADGAAREAVDLLRRGGTAVSHLTIYSLWPIPVFALRTMLTRHVRRVVIPELNIGLYANELRPHLGEAELFILERYDGGLITPTEIVNCVREAVLGLRTGRRAIPWPY